MSAATSSNSLSSVKANIFIEAPREKVFETFTNGIDRWWPKEHHILKAELASMTFEPRVGGNIIDRGTDGSECRWARVLAYDPPERVVFSWDITLDWRIETDPARTSEVEVKFISHGNDRTEVSLTHRNIDRHGSGWEGMLKAVGSENGWNRGLQGLKAALREASA